jgi:hypothetical protein
VRHRAGVDNIDIGGLVKLPLHKAGSAHLLANSLAIGLIDLAAQCSDRECFCLGMSIFVHKLFSIFRFS